jgi:hypothetical protein
MFTYIFINFNFFYKNCLLNYFMYITQMNLIVACFSTFFNYLSITKYISSIKLYIIGFSIRFIQTTKKMKVIETVMSSV